MNKKQFIMRIAMAAVIAFGVQTAANAQLGGLKGLANKAKKAVTEKAKETVNNAKKDAKQTVKQQAEQTVGETYEDVNVGEQYAIAKKADWTASSDYRVLLGDLAYHLKRVKQSTARGLGGFDFEAWAHVYRHVPSFFAVLEAKNQSLTGVGHVSGRMNSDIGQDNQGKELIEGWMAEMRDVDAAARKLINDEVGGRNGRSYDDYILDAWTKTVALMEAQRSTGGKQFCCDNAYEKLEMGLKMGWLKGQESGFASNMQKMKSTLATMPAEVKGWYATSLTYSDMEALTQQRVKENEAVKQAGNEAWSAKDASVKKDELLKMYKDAAAEGRYKAMPASKGVPSESTMKTYVQNTYSEWGKVVKVADPRDYTVHRDKLGNITYRSHAVYVLCEDQGYKVLHSIALHEDYKGGKYTNEVPRNDAWNSYINLVK